MVKMIKFDLPIDGIKVATLEDLRGHFTTEIVSQFRAGLLARWLRSRNMARELVAVEALTAGDDDVAVLKELCRIFEVEAHDDAIAAALAEETGVAGVRPGAVFRDAPTLPELVVVPAGRFWMGSVQQPIEDVSSVPYEHLVDEAEYMAISRGEVTDKVGLIVCKEGGSTRIPIEEPSHAVTINYPLAVGIYPVTFDEWDACVSDGGCGGHSPSDEGWGRGNRPVINVSWADARNYVTWLSWKTGKGYRLLNDTEWEYCARAGTTTRYWWGNEICEGRANWVGSGDSGTSPVGSFSANAFGLYDVHGNVNEWVEDHEGHRGAPADGSGSQGGSFRRILRGGSWGSTSTEICAASRKPWDFEKGSNTIGFRVVRTLVT